MSDAIFCNLIPVQRFDIMDIFFNRDLFMFFIRNDMRYSLNVPICVQIIFLTWQWMCTCICTRKSCLTLRYWRDVHIPPSDWTTLMGKITLMFRYYVMFIYVNFLPNSIASKLEYCLQVVTASERNAFGRPATVRCKDACGGTGTRSCSSWLL